MANETEGTSRLTRVALSLVGVAVALLAGGGIAWLARTHLVFDSLAWLRDLGRLAVDVIVLVPTLALLIALMLSVRAWSGLMSPEKRQRTKAIAALLIPSSLAAIMLITLGRILDTPFFAAAVAVLYGVVVILLLWYTILRDLLRPPGGGSDGRA